MRSTTVLTPMPSANRLSRRTVRANPIGAVAKGVFIGLALFVFGLVYLGITAVATCFRFVLDRLPRG